MQTTKDYGLMTAKNKEYKVITFTKGSVRRHEKVVATTHLQAAKKATKTGGYTHVLVVNKTARRYDAKNKLINVAPSLYKILWKGQEPSIVIMFGAVPELYKFADKFIRDKAFEEIEKCITSMSAGYAKAEAELTNIIVSLDEIKGTRSILTSKKISSGSAESATNSGTPTPYLTDNPSGRPNAEDTERNTWSSGSSPFRSRQPRTFLGTANVSKADANEYPGINESMKLLNGKSMWFKQCNSYGTKKMYHSKNNSWMWSEKWISKVAYAKLVGYDRSVEDGVRKNEVGKIFMFTKCGCGCGMYYNGNGHYAKKGMIEVGYTKEDFDRQNSLSKKSIAELPKTTLSSKEIDEILSKYYEVKNDKQNVEVGRKNDS